MKQPIILVRCDMCGGDDAETYPETNSKGKPVEIDLDKKCKDEFDALRRRAAEILAPLTELIDDKGVEPEKAAKPSKAAKAAARYEAAKGKRICLLCPETRDSDWNLRDHMRNDHGLSGSMVETYGTLCPVDGEPFDRIGHHIRQEHKDIVEGQHYSHAFIWAKEHGDPHGVVAKQIAELKRMATTKAA